MIIDKELLVDFSIESLDLVDKMESFMELIDETDNDKKCFEDYAQHIDRIMGAANSLGLSDLGKICELGKVVGYKISQSDNVALFPIASGVFLDTVDVLREHFTWMKDNPEEICATHSLENLKKRLQWLESKLKNIKRASVAIESDLPVDSKKRAA